MESRYLCGSPEITQSPSVHDWGERHLEGSASNGQMIRCGSPNQVYSESVLLKLSSTLRDLTGSPFSFCLNYLSCKEITAVKTKLLTELCYIFATLTDNLASFQGETGYRLKDGRDKAEMGMESILIPYSVSLPP